MSLYVDGSRVGASSTNFAQAYDGYWRVGGDNLGGRPQQVVSRSTEPLDGARMPRMMPRRPRKAAGSAGEDRGVAAKGLHLADYGVWVRRPYDSWYLRPFAVLPKI
jgi:hypothetical protein